MIPNSWHKSTRSGAAGHCVEAFWQKSSASNPSGNCVEVKGENDLVLVRDTKLGDASPVFSFTDAEWIVFTDEIRRGITCPVTGHFRVWVVENGMDLVDSERREVLRFTDDEWAAFVAGVKLGEFDLQPV